MKRIPLCPRDALDSRCILSEDAELTYSQVLFKAERLAERLPESRYCILLCERRDLFVIGFIAALSRQQTLLLPSNRTDGALQDILTDYPDSCCLVDDGAIPLAPKGLGCAWLDQVQGRSRAIPILAADHLAAIVFTSGTTGKPASNPKYWGDLARASAELQRRLRVDEAAVIVATVPAQHMYGLETSVLAVLLSGASVYGGRPFYPADVRQALALADTASTLVTTPLHLRACVAAGLEWPSVQQLISATAPLDRTLAIQAEALLHAPVQEIFGCSEAGSFASRETARQDEWRMYDGVQIEQTGETATISGGHIPWPVPLADRIEVLNSGRFRFIGRQDDMIKIAGKRTSLSELNIRLNSIPGVTDGVFVMRERQQTAVPRLLALVVAPALEVSRIQQALSTSIDPVFLPRPLLKVENLPRNELNKLPRQALEALLEGLGY